MWPKLAGIALLASSAMAADLAAVKTEANLEKRSQLALDYADRTLDAARQAYREGGDWGKVAGALGEVHDAVELAITSLRQSGRDPSRGPKYFKRAELKTRDLVRKLDALRHLVSFDEQEQVDKVRAFVLKVHDDILDGIMGKKHTWGRK